MKLIITPLLILGLAVVAFAEPQIGQPAPNFTARDIFGRTVSLNAYKGKIVVLESYYEDCPFCENHYKSGAMQELQKEMLTNGVVWLMINCAPPIQQQTPAKARQDWMNKKMALTDWIIDTGQIASIYAMRTAPQAFVINTNGVLAYQGAMDNLPQLYPDAYDTPNADPRKARNYVRAAVRALLAGKPVAVPETKPYGCRLIYSGSPDAQLFQPPGNMRRR
jgi:hypothetical protein